MVNSEPVSHEVELHDVIQKSKATDTQSLQKNKNGQVIKIVWFFDDNSFDEYYPRL